MYKKLLYFLFFRYLYIFYVYSIEESFLAPKSILMLLVVLFYKCWIKCIVCFSLSVIIILVFTTDYYSIFYR